MYRNIELRKLPIDALCNIIDILETDADWKRVMSVIPKDLESQHFEPKYNNEHIRMIEKHAEITNQKCTEILFSEWGTSGRVRPTLSTLKDVVMRAHIYRAADEIADILKEPAPPRPEGPAAPITLNVTEMLLNDRSGAQSTLESVDHEICNGITLQMKSESDMIKFSKSKIEHSNQHLINEKTTTPIKSDSDLLKFSTNHLKSDENVSMNIPNITAMLGSEKNLHQSSSSISYVTSTNESIGTSASVITESYNNNNHNPSMSYQTSFPNISISLEIESSILQDTNLIQFQYEELQTITNNFSETPSNGPCGISGRIGSGGFGDVFVGAHPKYGLLAVKKAHSHLSMHHKPDIAMKVFNSEVKFLSQFRHVNIVPILGFSKDGPTPCIVCEYIEGGSLQNNIAAKVLNEEHRINIMVGTAEGLKYLHTSDKSVQRSDILGSFIENDSQNSNKNFLHGDVKSANILLTRDCVPKLCDFGLAKQYDSTFVTTSPMGTSAYMAPEGLHGTITQKIDIFSFGIVLLELLTGLRPIVIQNGEKLNIKDYVEENSPNNDITSLLDPVINNWLKAKDIFDLALICLERDRKRRPTIVEVCDKLYKIRGD